MDELAGLLDGPRARGAFLLRVLMAPPWAIRVEDEAPLTIIMLMRGEAHISADGAEPLRMAAGDVVAARGPGHYTVADAPDTPVRVVIDPDQSCRTLYGEPLADRMSLGVRTWGDRPGDGGADLIVGTYRVGGEIGGRLLKMLPRLAHVPAGTWDTELPGMLAREIARDEPGQEVVLDRALDLLLIGALRAWFARQSTAAPSWYRARTDPQVSLALRLLHAAPERPWTVSALAAECGASRAALARRFSALVGEPPVAYLTSLRLAIAADLLRGSDDTLGSIARKVGYTSPFALSSAFKRVYGLSPADHRRDARVP